MPNDYKELVDAIRTMRRQDKLYQVLKRELTRLGHWRNLPRGNPQKGWQESHKQVEQPPANQQVSKEISHVE